MRRDTTALRDGGFEVLLDYNWIKKGWEVALLQPLGCWGHFNQEAAVCSNVVFCLWL